MAESQSGWHTEEVFARSKNLQKINIKITEFLKFFWIGTAFVDLCLSYSNSFLLDLCDDTMNITAEHKLTQAPYMSFMWCI